MSEFWDNQPAGEFCNLLSNEGLSVQPLGNNNFENILFEPDELIKVFTVLKEKSFNLLFSVSGTDYPEYFEVIYHIFSSEKNTNLIVKSRLSKSNPEIDSLSGLYSAANWHERETYDLLGINFKNHPDLRRILLPDSWIGHPLRKDYVQNDKRLVWNER